MATAAAAGREGHGGGGHAVHCIFQLSRAEHAHAHRHARTRTKHKPTFLYEHTHTHRSQIASVWDFRRGFSGTRTRTTDKAIAVRTGREAEDAVVRLPVLAHQIVAFVRWRGGGSRRRGVFVVNNGAVGSYTKHILFAVHYIDIVINMHIVRFHGVRWKERDIFCGLLLCCTKRIAIQHACGATCIGYGMHFVRAAFCVSDILL